MLRDVRLNVIYVGYLAYRIILITRYVRKSTVIIDDNVATTSTTWWLILVSIRHIMSSIM